jgi:hypothetical protein
MSAKPWWHGMAFDSAVCHPDPIIRAAAGRLGRRGSEFRIDRSKISYIKAKEPDMPIPRRRLGMDATPADEALAQLRAFLQERLSPDDLARTKGMLIALVHACGAGDMAADDPPSFPGMPKPGGTMAGAMDSRGRAVLAKHKATSRNMEKQFGADISRLKGF